MAPIPSTHLRSITNYIALSETIRLMAEIDQVIESHGGFPAAIPTSVHPANTDPTATPASAAPHTQLACPLSGPGKGRRDGDLGLRSSRHR